MKCYYSCPAEATMRVRDVGLSHTMDIPVCDAHQRGAQVLERFSIDPTALQRAADLAPMLTYAASLAGEGKQATPYIAMLASVRSELNRIFAASSGLEHAVHSTLPAPSTEESS